MIYYVIVQHFLLGLTIITSPGAINTSTLAVLNSILPDWHLGGVLLIMSACLAIYGAFASKNKYVSVFFFIPSLFFLWLFGLTAFNAVLQGHFADGVTRPWEFIFADQLPSMLLMFFMTVVFSEPLWNKNGYSI